MTTIITKHGNGVPPSLEVGELAVDKSEPALYTNTGNGIEKIGGGSGGSSLGGVGVLWGDSARYKTNGAEKYIQATVNGSKAQLLATTDDARYYCTPLYIQSVTWIRGDNTLVLKPTAVGGNIIGVVPRTPPQYLTRFKLIVDGRVIYDGADFFEADEDQAQLPVGPIVGEEVTMVYTLSNTPAGSLQFAYVGAGVGF